MPKVKELKTERIKYYDFEINKWREERVTPSHKNRDNERSKQFKMELGEYHYKYHVKKPKVKLTAPPPITSSKEGGKTAEYQITSIAESKPTSEPIIEPEQKEIPIDLIALGYPRPDECIDYKSHKEIGKVICISKKPHIKIRDPFGIIEPEDCKKCLEHRTEELLIKSINAEEKGKIAKGLIDNTLIVLAKHGKLKNTRLEERADGIIQTRVKYGIIDKKKEFQKELYRMAEEVRKAKEESFKMLGPLSKRNKELEETLKFKDEIIGSNKDLYEELNRLKKLLEDKEKEILSLNAKIMDLESKLNMGIDSQALLKEIEKLKEIVEIRDRYISNLERNIRVLNESKDRIESERYLELEKKYMNLDRNTKALLKGLRKAKLNPDDYLDYS